MTNKIIIKNAGFLCNLGITQKERSKKQKIFVSIDMFYDIKKPAKTDDINDTVDYFKVHKEVKKIIKTKEFNLVETMAQKIADLILNKFKVKKVKVLIKKPNALKSAKYCGVELIKECL